jgi:protein TonB
MTNYQELSMDDIIFEGRNKQYGAYQLRRSVDRHATIGLVLTLTLFALLALIGKVHFFEKPYHEKPIIDVVVHPSELQFPVDIVKPKPIVHTLPPQVNTIKDMEYNVVEHTVEPAPVKQEELVKYEASTVTHIEPVVTNNISPAVDKPLADAGTGTTIENAIEKISIPVNYAEVMPSFPGGKDALTEYLKKRIVPFQSDVDKGNAGKVVIRFYVDVDGTVRNPEVLKDGIGGRCAEATINAINKMPKWSPGRQGDKPVKVYYVLPVSFDFSHSSFY